MPARPSSNVVGVGVLAPARVAVRGSKEHQDLLPFPESDVSNPHRAGCRAEERLDRALEADGLFKSGARETRVGVQLPPLIREPRQTVDCSPDAIDRRINPGGEHGSNQKHRFLAPGLARVGAGVNVWPWPPRLKILARSFLCNQGAVA